MPAQLARQLERSRDSAEALQLLDGGTVVARGVNYGTAFEIALKIRELSGLLFEAYSGADLMHGPVAADRAGLARVRARAVGAGAGVDGRRRSTASRAAARRLIVASDDEALLARADVAFPLLPGVPEWLSPLTAVVPGQLAALRLARLRGHRSRPAARALEGDAHALASRR